MSTAFLYDHFTPFVLMQLEELGFCGRGEAKDWATVERLSLGGELPINTSGGLLGEAYIHGMNGITEVVRQIRGTACNQVAERRARARHRGHRRADERPDPLEGVTRPMPARQRRRRLAKRTIASNSASVSGMTERRFPFASRRHSRERRDRAQLVERDERKGTDRRDGHPIPARISWVARRVVVLALRIELRRVGLGALHDLADAGDTRRLRVRVVEDRSVIRSHLTQVDARLIAADAVPAFPAVAHEIVVRVHIRF